MQGATAKPIYEEVGPIAYRVNTTKLNIAFSADNTLVSFQRQKYAPLERPVPLERPKATPGPLERQKQPLTPFPLSL